jgi:hypothetical protein
VSILTDLTPAALTGAIEENLFALFRPIAALPAGELVETGELLLHQTGLSSPMFNGVLRTRDVPVETVGRRFSQPFFWWTGPQSPRRRTGFARHGDRAGGHRRARPPGVAVERAQDDAVLQLWGRMFCEAHGAPPAAPQACRAAVLAAWLS